MHQKILQTIACLACGVIGMSALAHDSTAHYMANEGLMVEHGDTKILSTRCSEIVTDNTCCYRRKWNRPCLPE